MARKKKLASGKYVTEWDPGVANPKQIEFFKSRALYTAYGGAKGGGKTWAVRTKAVGGAFTNAGIRILIMRRTYPELEENHIRPIIAMVPQHLASYNGQTRVMTFFNGSTIKFGHWSGEISEQEYQGLEFDWIFIDEATQFTERAFRYLGGCLRGVNAFPKRMYLTCNPGGVGHRWVKRLFIDKVYKTDSPNPEENENPADYVFIPATVEDNTALLNSPGGKGYLNFLSSMPEDQRKAFRYGDWNAMGGNYFPEFSQGLHTCEPFKIPDNWTRYRTIDYGLDMFACYWVAVNEEGRSYVYREYTEKGLIVQEAARKMIENTLPNEHITVTFAPPDMWSRQKDTGKTMAELFMLNNVGIVKADNNRVQGHMLIKDALAIWPDGKPGLIFFKTCKGIIGDIQDIQADDNNPNDCAKEPHEITHTVDAIRYYCISRVVKPEAVNTETEYPDDDDDEYYTDYADYMTGGEISRSYMAG